MTIDNFSIQTLIIFLWFRECPSLEANNSAGKLPPASIPPGIQSRDVVVPCVHSLDSQFVPQIVHGHGKFWICKETFADSKISGYVWTGPGGGGGYSHTLPVRVCAARLGGWVRVHFPEQRLVIEPNVPPNGVVILERGIHFRGVF